MSCGLRPMYMANVSLSEFFGNSSGSFALGLLHLCIGVDFFISIFEIQEFSKKRIFVHTTVVM